MLKLDIPMGSVSADFRPVRPFHICYTEKGSPAPAALAAGAGHYVLPFPIYH